jgi:ankyrin repeat protein
MEGFVPRALSSTFHLAIIILVVPLVLALAAGGPGSESIQAFHAAVKRGDAGAVEEMLRGEPSLLEARNQAGSTPLHTAARAGMLDVVKLLVDEGAAIDAGDNENTTPLQLAAIDGYADVIEFLISRGADVLCADDNGQTALHWASYGNHITVAKMMLDMGADIEARSADGTTPIQGAAYMGHTEMVEFLLSRGAFIDSANQWGLTGLLLAAYRDRPEVFDLLLAEGADPEVVSNGGATLLQFAVQSGSIEIVRRLISLGADLNGGGRERVPALFSAVQSGNPEMLAFLIEEGADVGAADDTGNTALHVAARSDNRAAVVTLLGSGADVNAVDEDGNSALDAAIAAGDAGIAGILLKNGADAAVPDPCFGRTPLHVAAAMGNAELAGMLLANGAGMDARDADGFTAFDLAARYGQRDVADLLAARGAASNRMIENYGKCALLKKSLDAGEALLWYTGHCGWAVKTRNHFMIFDYWTQGTEAESPCLANGHIDPDEIGDEQVTVFVTHEHADHFDTTIFDWESKVDRITYLFGFRPEELPQYSRTPYNGPAYEYIGPRESRDIGGIRVSTIRANDAGVGFLVKVDGLVFYHAGDHAGWAEGQKRGYTDEIDYLAGITDRVDIAFLNVTGCHAHDPEALKEGTYYTIVKLSPHAVIPTHAGTREYIYARAVNQAGHDGVEAEYICPKCRGDRFVYSKGRMRADMRDASS